MTMSRRDRSPRAGSATRSRPPSALRPGARPGGAVRRTRSVRRSSAGLTPTRAGALLALLLGLAGLYGAVSSDAFTVRRMDVSGLTWTDRGAVLATLAIPDDQNVFTLQTRDLEDRLGSIPAIRGAAVSIALPDEVRVAVTERTALLVWQVGDARYLVDATGLLFTQLDGSPPDAAAALPVLDDQRAAAAAFTVGSILEPVVLDAALRLGSLRPADVGSAAASLDLRLDDASGFVMKAPGIGWTAVFGFYTPSLRTTDLIPGQVRMLRSYFAGHGEDAALRMILADTRNLTVIPRATPSPTASAKS